MCGLDIIIRRDAETAGREAALAELVGKLVGMNREQKIAEAETYAHAALDRGDSVSARKWIALRDHFRAGGGLDGLPKQKKGGK